ADRIVVGFALARDRLGRELLVGSQLVNQVGAQIAREEPLVFLAGGLVGKRDPQPRAQYRFGLERVFQRGNGELVRIKELRVGPETHSRAGVALANAAHHFQLRRDFAVLEADVVFLAATPDPTLELFRKRVDHRYADAMEATGEL